MKVTKRDTHDELVKANDTTYLSHWNKAVKEAEFLEALSKKVEAHIVADTDSWLHQTVYVKYKKHRFIVWNRNLKFSCYIRMAHGIDHWRQKSRESFEPMNGYAFYKMTEKKLLAKLDREIEEIELADKLEKEAKKASDIKFVEARKKVDYIAKCLNLATVTSKRFNSYAVEWDSILSPISKQCEVSIDPRNYHVDDRGLDATYKLFKAIKS